MRRRDQGIVGLYEEELLSVNHHPDKFVGHKHCVSGDTNIPVNGVILPKMWGAHPLLCITASANIIAFKARGMSCFQTQNFRVRKTFVKQAFFS